MKNIHTGKTIHHREFGIGRVVNIDPERIVVNFARAGVKYFKPPEAEEVLGDSPFEEIIEEKGMNLDELKSAIREVLLEEGLIGENQMTDKWEGGHVILKPGRPGLQEKVIPVETLFNKIIMIRDRLRVLEQNINSNEKLSKTDKVNLQQYITRCYGSFYYPAHQGGVVEPALKELVRLKIARLNDCFT